MKNVNVLDILRNYSVGVSFGFFVWLCGVAWDVPYTSAGPIVAAFLAGRFCHHHLPLFLVIMADRNLNLVRKVIGLTITGGFVFGLNLAIVSIGLISGAVHPGFLVAIAFTCLMMIHTHEQMVAPFRDKNPK